MIRDNIPASTLSQRLSSPSYDKFDKPGDGKPDTIDDCPKSVEHDGNEHERINQHQALFNLIKAGIGTGILALPCAFKYAGIWNGLFFMIFLGLVSLYCMHMISTSAQVLSVRIKNDYLDYATVIEESFLSGPSYCAKISKYMRYLVNSLLLFSQLGCVAVYQVFVAENIKNVVDKTTNFHVCLKLYQLMLFALILPYLLIRSLKILTVFSVISEVIIFIGMFFIFFVCFTDLPPLSDRPAFASWSTFPFYIGIVIFSFENMGVILPLRRRMKHPEEMTSMLGVLNLCMLAVLTVNNMIGFFGYWKFGENTQESITFNLPQNGLFYAVQVMYSVAIFLTAAIQFYVPVNIIWDFLSTKTSEDSFLNKYGEFLLRASLVILTFLFALLVSHLDQIISLIGCLAGCSLIFIFPPLSNILLNYSDSHQQNKADETICLDDNENKALLNDGKRKNGFKYYARMSVNFLIIFFGIVLSAVGTYASVVLIIETPKKKKVPTATLR